MSNSCLYKWLHSEFCPVTVSCPVAQTQPDQRSWAWTRCSWLKIQFSIWPAELNCSCVHRIKFDICSITLQNELWNLRLAKIGGKREQLANVTGCVKKIFTHRLIEDISICKMPTKIVFNVRYYNRLHEKKNVNVYRLRSVSSYKNLLFFIFSELHSTEPIRSRKIE